jgi:hypothetical protein
VLDYVTTVSVGEEAPAESDPAPAPLGTPRGTSSDLRFALETILQMSRAQSDSLKAVVLAQADWVKGLATAKALPRNGYPVAAPTPMYRVLDESKRDDDDDDDDGDDDDDDDDRDDDRDAPASVPTMPPWVEAITSLTPTLKTFGELAGEYFKNKFSPTLTGPAASRNAAPEVPAGGTEPATAPTNPTNSPNPMIHLSEINVRLTAFERKFLNVLLRGAHGSEVTAMLIAMSVDEAVVFVKTNIARAQAAHQAATQDSDAPPVDAPPVDAPPADASPVDAPLPPATTTPIPAASDGSPSFTAHVLAASMHLTAEERANVIWLVQRFPAERLEALKAQLLKMEPRDAAAWIREHLPALRAEVSS